jgi:uncharacterized protein YjcR
VLLAAQGLQNKDIAEQLGVGRVQVSRWRERYLGSSNNQRFSMNPVTERCP